MLIERIAKELLLPEQWIERTAATASHCYKEISIPKRDGTKRRLFVPSRRLKAIQRVVADLFISQFPVHDAAHGYVRGRSTVTNAKKHAGNSYLGRADIVSFFSSIERQDIKKFVAQQHISGSPA